MKKAIKRKRFKRGEIVVSGHCIVLVTGKGDNSDYPSFSGVVLSDTKDEEGSGWETGMYSQTWSTNAFQKFDLPLAALMQLFLKSRKLHP